MIDPGERVRQAAQDALGAIWSETLDQTLIREGIRSSDPLRQCAAMESVRYLKQVDDDTIDAVIERLRSDESSRAGRQPPERWGVLVRETGR